MYINRCCYAGKICFSIYISLLIYNILSTKYDQNSNNSKEKSNYKHVIAYRLHNNQKKEGHFFVGLILVRPIVAIIIQLQNIKKLITSLFEESFHSGGL